MKCQACGSENQTGNFCASCGAALRSACASCGAESPPGSRFCTQCGEPLAGTRGGGRKWPWLVAGGVALLAVLVFMIPRTAERAGPPARTAPGTSPATGNGAPPALSGDMRVNADRLFNRIMSARQSGDIAEAERFMPMAVQAYGMVEDLDADGLYHLALLHLAAEDFPAARQTAARILEGSPDHVLGLGVAGAAAAGAGDRARASSLYRRLLEAYTAEAARPLPEYGDHQQMLPEYRRAAREYLGVDDG